MSWLQGAQVTSQVLWRGAAVFALLDLGLLFLLARRLKPDAFRELRGTLLAVTAAFWFLLWLSLASVVFWDTVYGYVFPSWSRWLLPVGQALLTTGVAALAHAIAVRLRGSPVVSYCLLGGVWGSLGHTWGVFMGLMDKPPMLHGASPVAAVVIAFFEFTFYFCIIVLVSLLLRRLRRGGRPV
jgi:hypothetical protein